MAAQGNKPAMDHSRRQFLKASAAAAAGVVTTPVAGGKLEREHGAVVRMIVSMFNTLPGYVALKIFAATGRTQTASAGAFQSRPCVRVRR
jgi:hypothetical protein